MRPYYEDASVTLFHGDALAVLPGLEQFDCAVTDPPYGETSLPWDRWPDGWPTVVADHTQSMWCFGSARMFDTYRDDLLADWRLSQDVIWSKGRGIGTVTDRFYRTHEHARHYYRGQWSAVYHESPREAVYGVRRGRVVQRPGSDKTWHGERQPSTWTDDGMRIVKSVIDIPGLWGHKGHPTQKPPAILEPLIGYSCPPGGVVLDPFAGSGSTGIAARACGRRAVLIEGHEPYCEAIARHLDQGVLDFGGSADRRAT